MYTSFLYTVKATKSGIISGFDHYCNYLHIMKWSHPGRDTYTFVEWNQRLDLGQNTKFKSLFY